MYDNILVSWSFHFSMYNRDDVSVLCTQVELFIYFTWETNGGKNQTTNTNGHKLMWKENGKRLLTEWEKKTKEKLLTVGIEWKQ